MTGCGVALPWQGTATASHGHGVARARRRTGTALLAEASAANIAARSTDL